MAHLSNFGVGNFRAFKDLYNFEFAPITVLTGTNSSGKSSLTKAMLLCKNSIPKNTNENGSLFEKLNFLPDLQIGNFNTTLNNDNETDVITVELPYRLSIRCLSTIRLSYKSSKEQVNNGTLTKLEIINKDDNSVLLTYSDEGEERGVKVDFRTLIKMAQFDSNILLDKAILERKLKETLVNLGIDKIDTSNIDNYPAEVISLHKILKKINYLLGNDGRYDKNTIDFINIYYEGSAGYFDDYLPLFDYHCIVNSMQPILSRKIYDLFECDNFKTWDDYQSFCKEQLIELTKKAEEAKISLLEYTLEQELEILNSLIFRDGSGKWIGIDEDSVSVNNCFANLQDFFGSNKILIDKAYIGWTTIWETVRKHKEQYQSIYRSELEGEDPIIHLTHDILPKYIINRKKVWTAIDSLKHEKDSSFYETNSSEFFREYFAQAFQRANYTLNMAFNSIHYVPSVRADVNRRYKLGENHTEFQKLLNLFFAKTPAGVKSFPFIDRYVSVFGIADKVEFLIAEDNYDSRVVIHKGGKLMNLADIGYGYAQVLPLILKLGLLINESWDDIALKINSSIMVIEEPETNLHPALQSKLADMFIECYRKYNIQFIVETHSEYLIRRLQRRTAEFYNQKRKNDLSVPTDFTKIYYFYPPDNVPEGEKQIYKIEIEKDGALTKNFGTGFFDEAGNEDLLLYQIAKHNRN